VIAALAAAVAIAVWLHPSLDFGYRGDTVAIAAPVASDDLASLLNQVRVVDRIDDVPGYERSCAKGKGCVFGPAWSDPLDVSGCDTRDRLVAKALQAVVFKPGTRKCKVIEGRLDPDPYSGKVIDLKQVSVDHIIPLKVAWDAGAWQWDLQQRRIFANDMTELIAVSGSANMAKGQSPLSDWLPETGQCLYALRYLTVAVKYNLPVTVKDRDAANAACI